MPRPGRRTRSKRRTYKSLPGSGQRVHYRTEASALQRCSSCGQRLAGVPRISRSNVSKLNRGKKKVERPYGGQVCHNCLKINLREASRSI